MMGRIKTHLAPAAWALFALAIAASAASAGEQPFKRIVSIGGAVTEIIYALGAGETLVGRDSTSTFPPLATALPDAGYMRALSAEGVMSLKPDVILAIEGSGPPDQLALLQSTGIPVRIIPEGYDAAAVAAKIEAVGKAVQREAEARVLAGKVTAALEAAAAGAARREGPQKRVLFILSLQDGKIQAAGQGTSADAIIRLAGGENALSAFKGYKAVTPEALIEAKPDVILMMARGTHPASAAEVFQDPALALTPAAASKAFVSMDGLYLLGFGPRTADAIHDLSKALYGPEP